MRLFQRPQPERVVVLDDDGDWAGTIRYYADGTVTREDPPDEDD